MVEWLSKSLHLWPELTLKPLKILPGLHPVTMPSPVPKEDITLTHSSYHLMLRILAWVIRFFDHVKLWWDRESSLIASAESRRVSNLTHWLVSAATRELATCSVVVSRNVELMYP